MRFLSSTNQAVIKKYGDLALQLWGVSNLRQYNAFMSPAALGPDNDCAGEGQQQ
jgi:hypothetical protein